MFFIELPKLAQLFSKILEIGITLAQWNTSEIILLRETGDRADVNYYPVSLFSNLEKLFMKII